MPTNAFSGDERISVETQDVKSLSFHWVCPLFIKAIFSYHILSQYYLQAKGES